MSMKQIAQLVLMVVALYKKHHCKLYKTSQDLLLNIKHVSQQIVVTFRYFDKKLSFHQAKSLTTINASIHQCISSINVSQSHISKY